MHIPPTQPRPWASTPQGEGEYYAADEQDKRRFAALLSGMPRNKNALPSAGSDSDADTRAKNLHWQGTEGLPQLPYWRMKSMLTSAWLRWRLTNGPLAGLEIRACRQGDEIAIRLHAQDTEALWRRVGSAQQLARQLAQLFHCQVRVEVDDEAAAAE